MNQKLIKDGKHHRFPKIEFEFRACSIAPSLYILTQWYDPRQPFTKAKPKEIKQKRTIDMILPIRSETIPDTVGPMIIPIIAATVNSSSIQPFLQTRLFSVVTDTLTNSLLIFGSKNLRFSETEPLSVNFWDHRRASILDKNPKSTLMTSQLRLTK